MVTRMFENMSQRDRETALRAACIKSEMRKFKRSLTEGELQDERGSYIAKEMKVQTMEQELKELVAKKKAVITLLKTDMAEQLEMLANVKRDVDEHLYFIPDYNAGKMFLIDRMGETIEVRDMRPDEAQGNLFLEGGKDAKQVPFVDEERPSMDDEQIENGEEGDEVSPEEEEVIDPETHDWNEDLQEWVKKEVVDPGETIPVDGGEEIETTYNADGQDKEVNGLNAEEDDLEAFKVGGEDDPGEALRAVHKAAEEGTEKPVKKPRKRGKKSED